MHYAAITDRLARLGSDKWDVHFRGRAMMAAGKPVIELTIGEPDVEPDPRLLEACADAMRAGRTRYSDGRGEPAVLDALAAKYSARSGRRITRDNVLCFPGTQTALYAAFTTILDPGDKVLVMDPYYATYEAVIRAPGGEVVPVLTRPGDGFHLRAEDLEAAVTPGCRALLLNSPHNPSGAVLTRDEIAAIGEVCRRHDLWIISDEVYETLTFGAAFASPFDLPDLADRTVALSSISKSHAAPGFRSGWAVGPAEFCRRALPLSETMLFGMQPFIADMTAVALTEDIPTAAIMRDQYQARAELISHRLQGQGGLRVLMPEAGMFVLVEVTGTGLEGEAFGNRLLDEQLVSVMPGIAFGEGGRDFIRMSLTVPDARLTDACDRIAAFASGLARTSAA